jgi:hypothetical protein
MFRVQPMRQSSTNILDVRRGVAGCLSRLLDRIPKYVGAALGWCVVQLLKACKREEVEEWR